MTKGYIWYPSRRYVELISTQLVPVLFPHYDAGSPNFQYLGAEGIGALESALAQPRQTFDGRYLYKSIFDKAAALIWSITKNHPFVDGNKRVALVTSFSFLAVNNVILVARQRDAIKVCLKVASSAPDFNQMQLSDWIRQNSLTDDDIAKYLSASPSKISELFSTYSDIERNALTDSLRVVWHIADILRKHREAEK